MRRTSVAVAAMVVAGTGCVDMTLLGIPLGPQGGSGLITLGVSAPSISTTGGCAFVGEALLLDGEMELSAGNTSANSYVAPLRVINTLNDNSAVRRQDQSPNQAGPYGGHDTNVVEIIGAHVRYEYPDETPQEALRFVTAQPLRGMPLLSGVVNDATGVLPSHTEGTVLATLIDRSFAEILFKDSKVKAAIKTTKGRYNVIAKVTLEGRSGLGTRVTSNELTFKIQLSKGHIANCVELDKACADLDPAFKAGRVGQCLPDQDVPECCGTCGDPATVTCS